MTRTPEELSADPEARRQAEIGKAKETGRAEGRADLLFKLLQSKFGKVPNVVRERLQGASADEVLLWAERILIAGRFDGVLGLGAARATSESDRAAAAEHAISTEKGRAESTALANGEQSVSRASKWSAEEERKFGERLYALDLTYTRKEGFTEGFNEAYAEAFPEDSVDRETLAAAFLRHVGDGSGNVSKDTRARVENATQKELWTWTRDLLCERRWNEEGWRSRKRDEG